MPQPVADELSGLSSGTALAAILRPLGLVLVPRRGADGTITLAVTGFRNAEEAWPVGWPSETPAHQTVPKLMEFLKVDIQDQRLVDVLEILSSRLETKMLLDHNSLARHRVEPSQVLVSVPAGRSFYKRILDRVLIQNMLKSEVRVDEGGTPFFWISTAKR